MSGRRFEWEQAIRLGGHGLTKHELLALLMFSKWANRDGVGWPSPGTLARALGYEGEIPLKNGTRRVKRLLKGAEEKGWITTVERGAGGARDNVTKRRLAIPATFPAPVVGGPPVVGEPSVPVVGETPLPVAGGPPEEIRGREKPAAAAARARGSQEPEQFKILLEGTELQGPGRADALAHWRVDPDRVEACVEAWWQRRDLARAQYRALPGPGLLVRMVCDGDDPRLDEPAEVPF